MDFRSLQQQLLRHLRARVSSGEVSERSLAHLSGLSQPHLHHVLKGARFLSLEMADQIMGRLQIDLLELVKEDSNDLGRQMPASRRVPFLEGTIGPGHPYPKRESLHSCYAFQAGDLHGLDSPAAAWLVQDPEMTGCFERGGVILLDRSKWTRSNLDEESYYALDLGRNSAVRRVRLSETRLFLRATEAGDDWRQWPWISLADRPLLEVVRGRARLMVTQL